jgi:hypothetical protein
MACLPLKILQNNQNQQKFLEVISNYNKVTECKVSIHILTAFSYISNEPWGFEIQNKVPF